MLFAYEIFTVFTLLVATVTGIMAFLSLKGPDKTYKVSKIISTKKPAHLNIHLGRFLLYFTIVVSTFSSLLAAFLRTLWVLDIGWDNAGDRWAYWWLTSHSLDAITYSTFHIMVYFRQRRVYEIANG